MGPATGPGDPAGSARRHAVFRSACVGRSARRVDDEQRHRAAGGGAVRAGGRHGRRSGCRSSGSSRRIVPATSSRTTSRSSSSIVRIFRGSSRLPGPMRRAGCAPGWRWSSFVCSTACSCGPGKRARAPVLTIQPPATPGDELPDLAESHFWAHAQVTGAAPAGLKQVIDSDPARTLSRLVCPRRSAPEYRVPGLRRAGVRGRTPRRPRSGRSRWRDAAAGVAIRHPVALGHRAARVLLVDVSHWRRRRFRGAGAATAAACRCRPASASDRSMSAAPGSSSRPHPRPARRAA